MQVGLSQMRSTPAAGGVRVHLSCPLEQYTEFSADLAGKFHIVVAVGLDATAGANAMLADLIIYTFLAAAAVHSTQQRQYRGKYYRPANCYCPAALRAQHGTVSILFSGAGSLCAQPAWHEKLGVLNKHVCSLGCIALVFGWWQVWSGCKLVAYSREIICSYATEPTAARVRQCILDEIET